MGNPPVFGGGLEVEFSRYSERGDSDEEEQIHGPADRRDLAASPMGGPSGHPLGLRHQTVLHDAEHFAEA